MLNLVRQLFDLSCSVRFGHATNSSSSHSIIVHTEKEMEKIKKGNFKGTPWSVVDDPGNYGWDHFVAYTYEDKFDYMWTMVYENCSRVMKGVTTNYKVNQEVTHLAKVELTNKIMGRPPYKIDTDDTIQIDHDSIIHFASGTLEHSTLHIEYIQWLVNLVLTNENAVIWGGNDNDAHEPPYSGIGTLDAVGSSYGSFVVYDRKDHWLLYNPLNGLKLRQRKDYSNDPVTHSDLVELVDIKITDYCAMNCSYCYQGSTVNGKHAKIDYNLYSVLKHMGVLEVALGGGEPTDFPGLTELIGNFKSYSITCNLTTRYPNRITQDMFDRGLSSIGFSVDHSSSLERSISNLRETGKDFLLKPNRMIIHVVLGTVTMDELVKIFEICAKNRLGVLLLGYKTDGRGSQIEPLPYDKWISVIKKKFVVNDKPYRGKYWRGPQLSVDTAIVNEFGDKIQRQLLVSPKLMSPGEGQFSMYMDLVNNKFAKASYGETTYYDLKMKADYILKTFQSWHTPPAENSSGT